MTAFCPGLGLGLAKSVKCNSATQEFSFIPKINKQDMLELGHQLLLTLMIFTLQEHTEHLHILSEHLFQARYHYEVRNELAITIK